MAGDREVTGRLHGGRKPVYRVESSFGARSPSLMNPVDQRTIRRMKGEWRATGVPPVTRGPGRFIKGRFLITDRDRRIIDRLARHLSEIGMYD
jgi:hypothetical protein